MLKILLATTVLTANDGALSLIDALKLAERHDAGFEIARANYSAELEQQNISQGALLPQVDFSAFVSEVSTKTTNSTSTSSPDGKSDFGTHGYSLVLSQTIYDKSLLDDADADNQRTAQALAELEAARQSLYVRVAEAYFDVAAAQDTPGVRDHKTRLQELAAELSVAAPTYDTRWTGPDHGREFHSTVAVGAVVGTGVGSTGGIAMHTPAE